MVTYSKPRRIGRRWYTRVYAAGRRTWQSLGTEDFQAARRAVAELTGTAGQLAEPDTIQIGTLRDEYLRRQAGRGLSANTMRLDRTYLALAVQYWGADRLVASIRPIDVEAFVAHLAEGRAPRGVNVILKTLKALFNWAVATELVARSPAAGVRSLPVAPRTIRVLTMDEEARLLAACATVDAELFGVVLVAIDSGLRQGTIRALEWDDVDLETGRWAIPAAKMKARRPYTCPIAPRILAYLRQRKGPPGPVFAPVHHSVWERARAIAGLSDVRLHDLRRSFVTRARRAGVSLEAACALGGWSNPTIVLQAYRAVGEDELRSALELTTPAPQTTQ